MYDRDFSPQNGWPRRACPACGGSSSKKVFQKEGVYFDRCGTCATVFVNPEPPPSLLEDLYAHYGDAYFTQPQKLAIDYAPDHYRREVEMIPAAKRNGSILDVGCSTGSFLRLAGVIGFGERRGIDISQKSVLQANVICGEGAAIAGDFLAQPFAPETFDVVTMWATLEHVAEPRKFLEESYRVLKPRGTLLVSVPNKNSLNFRMLGRKWDMVSLEHLNYYTGKSLALLLTSCGFRVCEAKTVAFNPLRCFRDLFRSSNRQPEISDQIRVSELSGRIRRAPFVARAGAALDRLLSATGLGDLLMVASVVSK